MLKRTSWVHTDTDAHPFPSTHPHIHPHTHPRLSTNTHCHARFHPHLKPLVFVFSSILQDTGVSIHTSRHWCFHPYLKILVFSSIPQDIDVFVHTSRPRCFHPNLKTRQLCFHPSSKPLIFVFSTILHASVCVRAYVCVWRGWGWWAGGRGGGGVRVIVKRPALPPCAVDGRSRNPLYFYYWFFHPFVRPFVLPPFHPFLKPFLFPLVPQPMRFSSGIPLKLSQFQLTLAATEPRNCLLGLEHRNKKPQESLCLPRADSCRSRFEWVYSV